MIIHLSKIFSFISFAFFCLLKSLDHFIKVFINLIKFISLLEMNNQLWLQDNFLSTSLLFILFSFTFSAFYGSLECVRLYPCYLTIFIFDKDLRHIAQNLKRIVINCMQLYLLELILKQVFHFKGKLLHRNLLYHNNVVYAGTRRL